MVDQLQGPNMKNRQNLAFCAHVFLNWLTVDSPWTCRLNSLFSWPATLVTVHRYLPASCTWALDISSTWLLLTTLMFLYGLSSRGTRFLSQRIEGGGIPMEGQLMLMVWFWMVTSSVSEATSVKMYAGTVKGRELVIKLIT